MIGPNSSLITPAQRLADTIVAERNLHPPVPIEDLVREVAQLKDARLRGTGLDALLHGLQGNSTPTVLIDADAAVTRRRFTLGHEFGHLSMAWHRGTLRCMVDRPELEVGAPVTTGRSLYLERDANQFASRLLIPRRFVDRLDLSDLGVAMEAMTPTEVSAEAAIYGLVSYLPPGNLLVLLDAYGKVISKMATSYGTVSLALRRGTPLDQTYLAPFLEKSGHARYRGAHIFWGRVIPTMSLTTTSTEWRPVLIKILTDYHLDPTPSGHLWMSINGVSSAAHSDVGHNDVEVLAQRIRHVFMRNEEHSRLAEHPDFDDYASSRARAFAAPKTTPRRAQPQ